MNLLDKLAMVVPFTRLRAYEDVLKKHLGDANTVLDIGCGEGRYKVFSHYVSTGVDIDEPSLAKAKENGYYNKLYLRDITQLKFNVRYDAIVSIQNIEHLTKEDGIKFLDKIEQYANKRIIVMTTWGYFPFPAHDGNSFQEHKCGWLPTEFEKRGYKTFPIIYYRWRSNQSVFGLAIGYLLSIILRPLIKRNPEIYAQDFVAIKEIKSG